MAPKFRVLLIEDDKDTQINIRDILALDDIEVTAVSTGRDALEFPAWPEISVAILDRKLPDGSADHLLPKIRQIAEHVDIVVITAFADLDSAINALRQGATDYLIKPVDPGHLRLRLKQMREHRQTQSALRKEHQFVDQLLNWAEAVILVLGLDGTVLRCNRYLASITERTLEEIAGENWFDLFVPEQDRQWVRGVFERTVLNMKTRGIVNSILTKSGQTRDIRWSNTTLTDAQGRAAAVLAIGLDITDLLEAQRKALQNERLATIGQTMTALAHESRNALQRIQASVELLRLDLKDQPEANQELFRIETASDDLQRLLEEIRTYAAPLKLNLVDSELNKVWRESWEDVTHTDSRRRGHLSEKLNGVSCKLSLDPARMRQVFRNLFENAFEACPDPVEVEIVVNQSKIDGQSAIELAISDNGPGLTTEQQNAIFDAFFTTKSGGTGLGMAIAKRIVEVHRGSIEARNAPGGGAEFKITLPTEAKRKSKIADAESEGALYK